MTHAASAHPSHDFWAQLYDAAPPRRRTLQVGGAELAMSVWEREHPDPGVPDLLLVHGGAAQRQWWDHIVPLLRGVGTVVAVDLSGHGESSHRSGYTVDQWSEEVDAVNRYMFPVPPVIVGHSLGGLVALNCAQKAPERYRGALIMDTPVWGASDNAHHQRRARIASRPAPTYASLDAAVARFRTAPPVLQAPPTVMAHVAESSYRRTSEGWTATYDPAIFARPPLPEGFVERPELPTVWVRCEHGVIHDAMAARILSELGPHAEFVELPVAGHHLLLDQPVATAWLITLFLNRQYGRKGEAPSWASATSGQDADGLKGFTPGSSDGR